MVTQGMDRRDVTGRLSGDFWVEGSYRRPVVSGDLRVDEGTLFVEEFQRAAEIDVGVALLHLASQIVPFGHQGYYRMRRLGHELGAVRAFKASTLPWLALGDFIVRGVGETPYA